jgi:isopentenyl phosphate kinase
MFARKGSVLSESIVIAKLGGSLITNKDRALSINLKGLRHVAQAIRKSNLPSGSKKLILVHGGGSFGHYYAKKFGLTTSFSKIDPFAISKTTGAMLELHTKLRNILLEEKVSTETIPPSELLNESRTRLSTMGSRRLNDCFANDLIPISYGNVDLSSKGASILSGDTICEAVAKSLPVERLVFAMDVDGIYADKGLRGSIISRLRNENQFTSKSRKYDVTGGIARKVSLGFRLAKHGVHVFFVNGEKGDRLLNILVGKSDAKATSIDIGKSEVRNWK